MTATRPLQSIRSRLLNPLYALLAGFIVIFSVNAWSFRSQYSDLSEQIDISSNVSRYVFDVSRNRANMLKTLLLLRLNKDPMHVHELAHLEAKRIAINSQNPWKEKSKSALRSQGLTLVGGLEEASFLQKEMVLAIKEQNLLRADEAFYQLSTIFEINSARLKDISLRLDAELSANEEKLRDLLLQIFWTLSASVGIFALTILLIATSYRKNVVGPMGNLHRGLKTLARGDLKLQIPVQSSPRELYEMVIDFNHMVKALESTQEELTRAREEALQAVRIKSDFLSNMSHEIRTPMNSIIGMTDMLAEAELTQDQRRYLQILHNSGQVLLNVVNDILDFSKLEAGNFTLEDISFDIRHLTSRLAELVEDTARKKKIGFFYTFEAEPYQWIRGDPKRIEQIILNIIGNAVKFTESGQINFTVSVKASSPRNILCLRFTDTGIGIAADKIPIIFNRFGQSDTSITRKFGGTGLGLAIVKQLVEAMNGSVSVSSRVGKGTEFNVEIPFLAGVKPSVAEIPAPPVEDNIKQFFFGKRVLLVDDQPDNRFLIKAYFKKLSCTIETAEDGQIAVQLFQMQDFDLVLMDMQMPNLDGYAATAKIREIERIRSRIRTPVIALTAYALAEEVARSYSVGCDLHLTKPIRKSDLFQAISRLTLRAPTA